MPFGEWASFEDCVQDMMNTQNYDEETAKKVCGKLQAQLGKESFGWVGDIKPFGKLIRGKALHPLKTTHPEEWPSVRVYLEEELQKSAHTLAGKPLLLDHMKLLRGEVLGAEYEDGAIEYVAKLDDPGILDKIRQGKIKHCSVEFEWKSLEQVNGVAPRGLNFTGLSLLKNFAPGDPLSTVEAWEGIVKELKEAKNVRRGGNQGTSTAKAMSTAKEQAEPQEFILYTIRDPAAFLEERFSTAWIDLENGIQAIYGRLREDPENPQPMALLFMKAKGWTIEKMQGWLQDHSQYLRQSEPAAAAPAGIQSVSPTSPIAQEGMKMEKEKRPRTLEGRVTFLETSKRLKEQELSKEEIEAKINELTQQRQDLENELQQIAEEEQPRRDEIWQKIDLISAELQAYEQALAAVVAGLTHPGGSAEEGKAKETEWTPEYVNDLPDSAFAVIAAGGEKDEQGKTVPRTLRKLPHHNAEGNLDLPHLRNALARVNQIEPANLQAEAKKHLCGHARSEKAEDLVSEFCGEEPGTATEQGNQEPEKDEHGCIIGKEKWDPETEKCVPITTEQQGEEPEKDEHGCIVGKERYDEEQEKCVPIATEKAVEIVTKMLEATEQAEDMTVEEIKQKLVDLAKQKEELDNKLWPEAPTPSPLSEEERVTIQAQIDVLYAEIEAYEQLLAVKIAGQAAESKKKSLGEAIIEPGAPQQPTFLVPVEKLEAKLPPLQAERSMNLGAQRFVQDVKRLIREAKEVSKSG